MREARKRGKVEKEGRREGGKRRGNGARRKKMEEEDIEEVEMWVGIE
jgi:hypothetical protein